MTFEAISRTPLPDHDAEGRQFRHKAHKTLVYHVHNKDRENLFAFIFKTPQENSKGIAHILEHSVLCGSKRFPVKDPFAQLLRGSMHTFLNAMTYPDRTVYPAASAVEKDLFNIMKVYGDAVFFPLLKREMFLQEGHRIEYGDHPSIQGIVYNEMMGNMSNKEYLSATKTFSSVFESGIYSHESGGDPEVIPELSYEEFVAFHRDYYHPANCCIFLYGDIPSERYLEFIEREFLSRIATAPRHTVSLEHATPRWNAPRSLRSAYPVSDAQQEQKNSLIVSWLLSPVTDIRHTLTMNIVSELLLGNKAAPLYKALTESKLGESLSTSSGLELDAYESVFSVGLDGVEKAKESELEALIMGTLEEIASEGFSGAQIEAVLRKVEFSTREVEGGARNGLRLMRRLSRAWGYESELDAVFQLSSTLKEIRGTLTGKKEYLQSFVRDCFVDNTHRTTLTMYPDATLSQQRALRQEELLRAILAAPDAPQRTAEAEAFHRMQEAQDSEEALASIPRLKREDIPTKVREFSCGHELLAEKVPLIHHDLFTNHIAYLSLAFDLEGLGDEELDLLPLFSDAILECGLKTMSYEELANEIDLHTGGISLHVENSAMKEDKGRMRPICYVHISFAQEHCHRALALLFRIFDEAEFSDSERLRATHLEQLHSSASALTQSGHKFAYHRAARGLSPVAALSERWEGLHQLVFLHALQSKHDTHASLSALRETLFVQNRLSASLVCDGSQKKDVVPLLEAHVAALAKGRYRRNSSGYSPAMEKYPPHEAILTSSSVSYNAIAFPAMHVRSEAYPAQRILAHLLDSDYLWEAIRTRGGAYGFGTFDRAYEGIMAMVSYRDPHIAPTFQCFRDALRHFAETPCTPQHIDLALFSIVGREERTLVPREQGNIQFHRQLYDISTAFRQKLRDALLAVTPRDIQEISAQLLQNAEQGCMAAVTSKELLERPNEKLSELQSKVVTPPL